MSEAPTIRIDRLGAKGDGIGEDGNAYPFTLPGEEVTGEAPYAIVTSAPARVEPSCAHFGSCGGCSLQHMALPDYLIWKRQVVIDTLGQRGIEAPVEPCFACRPGERRRVQFTARRTESGLIFGYHAPASKRIVSVEDWAFLYAHDP
ncbi:MAG: RNA methyltransferase, partial [Pseudomonadota bacterium]